MNTMPIFFLVNNLPYPENLMASMRYAKADKPAPVIRYLPRTVLQVMWSPSAQMPDKIPPPCRCEHCKYKSLHTFVIPVLQSVYGNRKQNDERKN